VAGKALSAEVNALLIVEAKGLATLCAAADVAKLLSKEGDEGLETLLWRPRQLVTPSGREPALQWKKWSPYRHEPKSVTGPEVRAEARAQVGTQVVMRPIALMGRPKERPKATSY